MHPPGVAADLAAGGAGGLVDDQEAGATVGRTVEAVMVRVRGPAAHAAHGARATDRRVRGTSGQHGFGLRFLSGTHARSPACRPMSLSASVLWTGALLTASHRRG